jgi:hypothetical protein
MVLLHWVGVFLLMLFRAFGNTTAITWMVNAVIRTFVGLICGIT